MKKEIKVDAWSKTTLGIKDDKNVWYNAPDSMSDTASEKIKEKVDSLVKGAKIELTMNESGKYTDIEIIEIPEITDKDEMVGFEEILKKAHEKYEDLIGIKSDVKYLPGDIWMAKAMVVIRNPNADPETSRVFEAHGEATLENVGEYMKKCMPRMAETRAISRALRLALGEWVPESLKDKE